MDGFPERSLQMCTDFSQSQTQQASQTSFSSLSNAIITARDEHEQRRLQALRSLGLLQTSDVTLFDEATQRAARFLDASICFLGIMGCDRLWLRSAVGLSHLGAKSHLASVRQIPRHESFCNRVIQSGQALAIEDTQAISDYQHLALVTRYGIRAYLGVPLVLSSGEYVGTLAVLEPQKRAFSEKDVVFLEAIARWCMSEVERHHLTLQISAQAQAPGVTEPHFSEVIPSDTMATPSHQHHPAPSHNTSAAQLYQFKGNLIGHMVQDLQTPLTSILGMTRVLTREIYGPLTNKQQEYMNIVHHSGQYLHSLVNEITGLSELDEHQSQLDLNSVDIEMLCQQALATLQRVATGRAQGLNLSVEPGHRIWLLDKNNVRQILYHLVFRVIQVSHTESIVRVHVSRKDQCLNIAVWPSHPWLGEGLPHSEFDAYHKLLQHETTQQESAKPESPGSGDALLTREKPRHTDDPGWTTPVEISQSQGSQADLERFSEPGASHAEKGAEPDSNSGNVLRRNLGLRLSQVLAGLHGGSVSLQGSPESGYRYVIVLPQFQSADP
ncbi:MAG: GAF domain-containing sensor histidine kinase [Elainellaceae cyanobacterium]